MADATYAPKTYRKAGGDEHVIANGGLQTIEAGGLQIDATNPLVHSVRMRFTILQINTGATILAAITGYKYRVVDCFATAYGGAVGATTTLDIIGTQAAAPVKLAAFAQAGLTQSAVLKMGGTSAAVLADGASFALNDVSTAITIGKTGSDLTVATGVDVILSYTIEA